MKATRRFVVGMYLAAASAAIALLSAAAVAQAPAAPQGPGRGQEGPGRGQGGGRGPAPVVNLPQSPTAVALPTVSDVITGPGPGYESVQ